MSPNEAPRSFSLPSKIFVLGEYAVLARLPTLVAAIPPRFQIVSSHEPKSHFAAQSPAARFLKTLGKNPQFEFLDPHEGRGGFGGSSAEFALAFALSGGRALPEDWERVWALFRELSQTSLVPPSGADLIAQWLGGVVLFDPDQRRVQDYSRQLDWSGLMVFSGTHQDGRKVATHTHLQSLAETGFLRGSGPLMEELAIVLDTALQALHESNAESFGKAMDQYAQVLNQYELEIPATTRDREALRKIPGVLGVKGSGALQADAILVWAKPAAKKKVLKEAESLGLKLVADGIGHEKGIVALAG